MKRCAFLYKSLMRSNDFTNTNNLVIGSTHSNSDNVLYTQGSKGFNRVYSLRSTTPAIQKTNVRIFNFPDGTAIAKFYMEFICDESCGKCSPCRIGTKRMLEILTRITEGNGTMQDLEELEELGQTVKANSLCALGQTAANPIISTTGEYEQRIFNKNE